MSAVPAGYKQTEVGVIPVDWEASTVGENSKWMSGGTPRRNNAEFWSGTIPWISGSTLKTVEISTSDQFLTADAVVAGSKMAPVDSTLLLVRGSALHNEIRAGLVVLPVAFNQDVKALVPHATVEPKFLTYYILAQSNELLTLVSSAGNSAGVLDTALVQHYKFLKPPLTEQRAIAAALSDVDALLAKLDQFIAKKRDLKQAAMQQLLTGQTRLPGFSGEWKVQRLGDIGNCLRGVTYKGDSDLSPYDTAHTKRLLRSNNVQNFTVVTTDIQFVNAARVSENQLLRGDDILICMANGSKALVGKAGLFTVNDGFKYTFGAFMGCFRSNSVESNSTFVFFLFQTGRYRNYINNLLAGSSINNLNPSSIESLEFSIPLLPEQTAIATVLSDMDSEIATLEARRDKTRALKQGMMQELLTGRIRLV